MKTVISLFVLGPLLWLSFMPSSCACGTPRVLSISTRAILPDDYAQRRVGEVLWATRGTLASLTGANEPLVCRDNGEGVPVHIAGRLAGNEIGARVHPTAVAGIGIRVMVVARGQTGGPYVRSIPFEDYFSGDLARSPGTRDIALKIELVKTGTATGRSGTAAFFQDALLVFATKNIPDVRVQLRLAIAAPPARCQLRLDNPVISLSPVKMSELNQKGSVESGKLEIGYSCTDPSHLLSLTINGTTTERKPDVLETVQDKNSARGVGIQLFYKNAVVTPGHPVVLPRSEENAESRITLNAGYVMTQKNVTPGKVNTVIVLQLQYL